MNVTAKDIAQLMIIVLSFAPDRKIGTGCFALANGH